MYVVYRVILKRQVEYQRMKEFDTLEEANDFLGQQETTEAESYTIMIE